MASAEPKDPWIGRTIAQRYRLISRLGAGSVATVYLARHVLIERLSAIKIVHPEIAKDPLWRERFLREARAVNRVNHPNIVEISDLGEADGALYLVMEYVPGESLKQLLERGPIGWRRAAKLGQEIASALGRAHEMGVVHRDLEPANILVVARRDGGELVKLTDFGLAKLADAAPLTIRVPPPPSDGATRTSRERDLLDRDARTDLFALGSVLYEATAGATPGEPPATIASAPPFFNAVLATLLASDPAERPRDGYEAADLLRRALDMDPPTSSPTSVPRISTPAPPSPQRVSWIPILEASTPSRPDLGPRSDPPTGIREVPVQRLAVALGEALATLEDRVEARVMEQGPLGADARAALDEARKLVTTASIVNELVGSDLRTLEGVEARGRARLADLGQKLDEVAREHSRMLGWAGTIAERTYQVEAQRLSGEHPVPAIEALVWEQAALEQEEDRAREDIARIEARMRAEKAEMRRQSDRAEHEVLVINACLEGRLGALRSLAAEAWAALESAARLAGVEPIESSAA
jgi:serine/threonine-protein kinase